MGRSAAGGPPRRPRRAPHLPPSAPPRPGKETAGGSRLPGCGSLPVRCGRAPRLGVRGIRGHVPTFRRGPQGTRVCGTARPLGSGRQPVDTPWARRGGNGLPRAPGPGSPPPARHQARRSRDAGPRLPPRGAHARSGAGG